MLLVRGLSGETRFYDIPTNHHEGGILRTSTVPSALPPAHQARAREIAGKLADALGYVGLIGVEMFYVGEGPEPLLINEFAPRVHNSGHWTMDGCAVGQFENHIRAVAGWPLGCDRPPFGLPDDQSDRRRCCRLAAIGRRTRRLPASLREERGP